MTSGLCDEKLCHMSQTSGPREACHSEAFKRHSQAQRIQWFETQKSSKMAGEDLDNAWAGVVKVHFPVHVQ